MIANDLLDFGEESRKRSFHGSGESIAMSEILPCNSEDVSFRRGLIEFAGEMQHLFRRVHVRKLPGRGCDHVLIGNLAKANIARLIAVSIFEGSRVQEDHKTAVLRGIRNFWSKLMQADDLNF